MNGSRRRDVHGILLLDKATGITSNGALQRAKRLLGARKAGHTGSLDELATGLLPLCFGEATKVSAHLLDAHKRYRTRVRLGERTSTADALGEPLESRPVPPLDAARVEQVLAGFRGTIAQVPPMHSALKRDGQPLYKLAHRGLEVARQPREVHIFSLELLSLGPAEIELDVRCSKGTYIRTLAEDIGEALGCGAHVARLRRTEVAGFRVEEAVTLEGLEARMAEGQAAADALLRPADAALAHLPEVRLSEAGAFYLLHGQAVQAPHAPTEGLVRLYDGGRSFLGLGEITDDGRVAPRRLMRSGGGA